ncbi:MAG TPA: heme ABC transporter permease CcmB, partial [Acidobacteria bacterium]|nr:heme ABC transporter permease CcmB [Acidobacteriota bacterium]
LPVLLWLILLFSVAAGLPRAFVQEEETQTATALRLCATPSALFCGKLLYALTLVAGLEELITPLYVMIMNLQVARAGL